MAAVEAANVLLHLRAGNVLPDLENTPLCHLRTAGCAGSQGNGQGRGCHQAGSQAPGPRPPRGLSPRGGQGAPAAGCRRSGHLAHCPSERPFTVLPLAVMAPLAAHTRLPPMVLPVTELPL